MGLSIAISGGIIMFGLVYLILVISGITDNIVAISDTSTQKANLENDLQKTSISLKVKDPKKDTTNFTLEIKNTNLKKLFDFAKFDIFVTYVSGGTTYNEIPTYVPNCPPNNREWCIESWKNDLLDPNILNTGETITVKVEIDNPLQQDTNVVVVVSTPNGVVASDSGKVKK